MPPARRRAPVVLSEALLQAWATNQRITEYLIQNLDEKAWRAEPPGGKGRTIAAIVAHIHNVRHAYAISHDAHHRGQICLLARQLGHAVPQEVGFGMWDWGKRWKECGFEEKA